MPLDYSGGKEAMGNNIKAEIAAGKPQRQAVAIAESVKRRGKPKGKSVKKEVAAHMHKLKNNLRTY